MPTAPCTCIASALASYLDDQAGVLIHQALHLLDSEALTELAACCLAARVCR